jgi:UDP-3-O-[3-hydroxymyristoyl] glucosamine N-acyltransferase
VIIGGSASIKDHTTLGSGAIIGAGSGVVSDVPAGKTVLGYPGRSSRCLETMGYFKRLVNESKK